MHKNVIVVVSSPHQSPRWGVSPTSWRLMRLANNNNMRCFAASVGVVHDDSTVSVVRFDIAGTLNQKDVAALPPSAACHQKGDLTSRESSEVWLPIESVGKSGRKESTSCRIERMPWCIVSKSTDRPSIMRMASRRSSSEYITSLWKRRIVVTVLVINTICRLTPSMQIIVK